MPYKIIRQVDDWMEKVSMAFYLRAKIGSINSKAPYFPLSPYFSIAILGIITTTLDASNL